MVDVLKVDLHLGNEESADTQAANSPDSVYLRMPIPGGPLTLAPIGGDDFSVYQVYRTKRCVLLIFIVSILSPL
jgi:hypothetical protein